MRKKLILIFAAVLIVSSILSFVVIKNLNYKAPLPQKVIHEIALKNGKATPDTLIVKLGEFVQFNAKDDIKHIIAQGKGDDYGNIHDHTSDGVESKEFGQGEGYLVNFNKTGTFYFHDHLNSQEFVTIVVYDKNNPAKII